MPDRSTAEVAATTLDLAHHYRLTARSVAAIAGEWSASDDARRGRARGGSPASGHGSAWARWPSGSSPTRRGTTWCSRTGSGSCSATWSGTSGTAPASTTTGASRAQSARGLGITALFAGESGTGKTMAAEVIAGDLGLDLFRIDLSAVVSKYIGETEKNLRAVFDAAEAGGAVLLFDEADALFGKRSEVKDSHDRYANLEVAYLLQRMESYRGLAILTTNLRSNVDRAFLRRLRFVVQFPFPDEAARGRDLAPGLPASGAPRRPRARGAGQAADQRRFDPLDRPRGRLLRRRGRHRRSSLGTCSAPPRWSTPRPSARSPTAETAAVRGGGAR